TSLRIRTVTWSAPRRNFLRGRCGTFLRPDSRLRPAPRRAPPQRGNGSSCWIAFILGAYVRGLTLPRTRERWECRPMRWRLRRRAPRGPPNHLEWADMILPDTCQGGVPCGERPRRRARRPRDGR